MEEVGENRFRSASSDGRGGVVFGGQLLGQAVLIASRYPPGEVKSIHMVFPRAAAAGQPLDYVVDPMHGGRTFGSVTVSAMQGDRLCARAIVLLHGDEPDLIRFESAAPEVPKPDDVEASPEHVPGWDIRVVGGVDISDPDAVGPPELDVWTRFPGAGHDPVAGQALLAYATDGFLIGPAMRPHEGVGQAQAHVTLSTGVITHTLTFHERFGAEDWLLLHQHSPYAGRGRSYGRAHV